MSMFVWLNNDPKGIIANDPKRINRNLFGNRWTTPSCSCAAGMVSDRTCFARWTVLTDR